jgi:hypothetical protein
LYAALLLARKLKMLDASDVIKEEGKIIPVTVLGSP